MEKPITYVGLDVHKETIVVALAEAGERGEVRAHGEIANTPTALKALVSRLARSRARCCGSATVTALPSTAPAVTGPSGS